jgi:DNA-binding response OmpR family regulator
VTNPNHLELLTPRILVVDDERQIHVSVRLRLAKDYEVVCCSNAREALEAIAANRFDLCFVDIHMPEMDGFTFIQNAQRCDAALGYVVLSAFDSSENLRRSIPLRVFDFVGKPLPERDEFEARVPGWIARTHAQRRDHALVQEGKNIHGDLDAARLEREVELVASETARDALLQTANLLTTIQAHLVSASSAAAARAKSDPALLPLSRNLEEARKTADAAATVTQGFFDSAYAHRDSSPALVAPGVRQAAGIAIRMSGAETANKTIDLTSASVGEHISLPGLSGIELLLMMVPILGAALVRADANTTVGVDLQPLARLEIAVKEPSFRTYLWANRKTTPVTRAGVLLTITAAAPALSRAEAEAWLKGAGGPLPTISPRGLIAGLQKCRGFIAVSLRPQSEKFQLVVGLPT